MSSFWISTYAFSGMFQNCYSLKHIPVFNITLARDNTTVSYGNMFNNARNLSEIPAFDFSGSTGSNNTTSLNNVFSGTLTLRRIRATGFAQSLTLPNPNMMGASALDELYTNLAVVGASGAGAKTITVTGSLGTAGDNPSIATAKGWTVTG